MAIESTEHSLATRFTTVANKFNWNPTTPFTPTPDLLLSSQAVTQLKNLITKVVGKYKQSTLNTHTHTHTVNKRTH